MRMIDIVAAILLVVGGMNWGLVGLADFDLVASLFGAGSVLARAVYTLVGLAAAYQALSLRAIQKRWHLQPATA